MNESNDPCFPLSFFDFIKVIARQASEGNGDYFDLKQIFEELTFESAIGLIGDTLLTFFMIFFIAKWVFDILISIGKGGKR